jgi:hypothetical protein
MIETLFTWPSVRSKQLEAPLLKEREQYLRHMLNEGVSIEHVKTVATMLLHVVRLLELNRPRTVSLVEIEQGSQLWCKDTEYHITRKVGPSSGESFHYAALNWLRFSQMMVLATTHAGPVETIVEDFVLFMKETRRMSPQSIRSYRSRIFHFLKWALCRVERVSMISLQDVDEFLEMKRGEGCLPRTIRSFCTVFRLFFRYAETPGLGRFQNCARHPWPSCCKIRPFTKRSSLERCPTPTGE